MDIRTTPALDLYTQQFKLSLNRPLQINHLSFELIPEDSVLRVHSLDFAEDGTYGVYSGSYDVQYIKTDIGRVFSGPLRIVESYPTTFARISAQLKTEYGLLVEPGDFGFDSESFFEPSTVLSKSPMVENNVLQLVVTKHSGRWQTGGQLALRIVEPRVNLNTVIPTNIEFDIARLL